MRDGSRHIIALLLPGDFCDMQAALLYRMDHGIAAITPVKVACVDVTQIAAFSRDRPNLTLALEWSTLVDLAILRTWMIGLSGRSALGRVAHMVCELRDRSDSVGLGDYPRYPFPLTQVELAEATGQTAVHANRIVSQLRSSGLADIREGIVTILDNVGLEAAAEYEPTYLYRGQSKRAT
ncbi:MAG: Crp/Fnr family transcriptional regulator [Oxalobacteraceae bacterium]|nr:MAG: Crp/Fnr family transcriptional regulator [Oxalobacteraceae bacterium]